MKKPQVAVITRTKNRPILLERAIKSVVDQTFKDYILVIVNDGGEKTPVAKVVAKYAAQLKDKVKIINNTESIGMEAASNKGIAESESKYIALLDDDDTWNNKFLSRTVEFLDNSSLKGVATKSEVIIERVSESGIELIRREPFSSDTNSINYFSICGVNQFTNNSFVYSREALAVTGLYNEKTKVLGDWDFNMRFLSHFDIGYIEEVLVYYHRRLADEGDMSNSVANDGHRNYTTEILNSSLRADIEKGAIGLGFASNLSHQMHLDNARHQNRFEQLLHHVDSIQSSITILNDSIGILNEKAVALEAQLNQTNILLHRSTAKRILGKLRNKTRNFRHK